KKPHRQRSKPAAGARVVREPELDEVAEEVPKIERAAESEDRAEDRGKRAATHRFFDEDQDRDRAEEGGHEEGPHRQLARRSGSVQMRDDEENDEDDADQPRL